MCVCVCVCACVRACVCTARCSEIGSLASLDAPECHASSDVREPISLHQAVCVCVCVCHTMKESARRMASTTNDTGDISS